MPPQMRGSTALLITSILVPTLAKGLEQFIRVLRRGFREVSYSLVEISVEPWTGKEWHMAQACILSRDAAFFLFETYND